MGTRAGWRAGALRGAGAGLLVASGAIHLDLYLTGYRTIPVIGWLFLAQVIAAFGLGLTILAVPARLVTGQRLAAAAGAGFCLATLGGYLLSIWPGLFGFTEVRTAAGIAAGLVEAAGFVVLAALALAPVATRWAVVGAAALEAAALVLFGVAVAGAGSAAPVAAASTSRGSAGQGSAGQSSAGQSSATVLKTTTIGGTKVLTNARGFTLYWFAPDTAAASKCYGSCAAYWPPVTGTAAAAPGVPGRIGTIRRTGGSVQLTYDGHPLYTYIGDSAPGQARGNHLNLNGGLWHDVPASS